MIKLEELAQDIYGAIEHGEALYEKDMFDSLIADIQELVDECHREFFKNQEELEKEVESAAPTKSTEPPKESMKILVFYAGTGCTGRIPIEVDRDEIDFDDFEKIEKKLKVSLEDEALIITNMIKLPFR